MATEKLFEAIKEDDLKKFKWALGQSDVNIDHQQTVGITIEFIW